MKVYESRKYCCEAGYNLVGISLFMVVLGILFAGGLGLKQKYDWAKKQDVTIANTMVVKEALKNYQALHGTLPCPASLTDAPSSANFGKSSDCSVPVASNSGVFFDTGRGAREIRYGAVPVRTLGIPDQALVDGWGHRYVYAVTQYYTVGTPDPNFDFGAIHIRDKDGQNITNTDGNVIYTVMSPGADERGAYTMAGTQIETCRGVNTNCVEQTGDGSLQVTLFKQYNTNTHVGNTDFSATMTYEASAKSYEWIPGNWVGACTCANPRQTRGVTCVERGTSIAAPGLCAMSDRPDVQRSCADFCWGPIADFPSCPSGCDLPASTVTRAPPECLENNDKDVPDSLCISSKGPHGFALSQACPATGSCTTTSGGGGDHWEGFVNGHYVTVSGSDITVGASRTGAGGSYGSTTPTRDTVTNNVNSGNQPNTGTCASARC